MKKTVAISLLQSDKKTQRPLLYMFARKSLVEANESFEFK
jgi:hypothetical protein